MTYVPKTAPPHPTGFHKPLFDEIRRRRGLDEDGKPVKIDTMAIDQQAEYETGDKPAS